MFKLTLIHHGSLPLPLSGNRQLDEVGFEWMPKGNTMMKWDEALELLVSATMCPAFFSHELHHLRSSILCLQQLEFRRRNGHFKVPNPREAAMKASTESGDASVAVDSRSQAQRLYNWVNSLHRLYRQYQLGRKSGWLTNERILVLLKHGFEFQDDPTSFYTAGLMDKK